MQVWLVLVWRPVQTFGSRALSEMDNSAIQEACCDRALFDSSSYHSFQCYHFRFLLETGKTILIFLKIITKALIFFQMNEKLPLTHPERAYCCTSENRDVCGRSDCMWPCTTTTYEGDIDRETEGAFFFETSGRRSLNYRQACAVESLAKLNPNLTVYALLTAEIDREAPSYGSLTKHYPNIVFSYLDVGDFVAGTDFEKWYYCTNWNRGWYAVSHLSDALRFLTLQRYGGYYFDLDVIHMRPVTRYRNFAAYQDTRKIAVGALHFDRGHAVIEDIGRTFPGNYKWYWWDDAGVGLITRTLKEWCGENYVPWMTPDKCRGFHVMGSTSFYPVDYVHKYSFFEMREDDDRAPILDDENVIGAHVWNYASIGYQVIKYSNQYYVQLAKNFCPHTYAVTPLEF